MSKREATAGMTTSGPLTLVGSGVLALLLGLIIGTGNGKGSRQVS